MLWKMENIDNLNEIIEKNEKKIENEERGKIEGERMEVKEIYEIEGMVKGWGNKKIMEE